MSEPKRVGPGEAHAKMGEGYSYVDVRTAEEFAEGHPAGAFNVPILVRSAGRMDPNPDFGRVMSAAFSTTSGIVVGCRSGGRSLRAAQVLAQAGFTDVLDQFAGWDGARNPFGQLVEPGWTAAKLPQESGAPEGRSYADLRKKAAR